MTSIKFWSCSLCKTRRTSMTNDQLLSTYANNIQLTEKVNKECVDGKSYAWCTSFGDIATEPTSARVPIHMGAVQCVHCQFTPENGGKKKTYAPKLMYENLEDEKKIVRLGEPNTTSKKSWFWECSLCHFREPMLKSSLKCKYVEQSFVKSLESSLDKRRKKLMNKEDVEDIKAGLGGTPTLLVEERDIPAPEWYY
jgi:hypothetical protein